MTRPLFTQAMIVSRFASATIVFYSLSGFSDVLIRTFDTCNNRKFSASKHLLFCSRDTVFGCGPDDDDLACFLEQLPSEAHPQKTAMSVSVQRVNSSVAVLLVVRKPTGIIPLSGKNLSFKVEIEADIHDYF